MDEQLFQDVLERFFLYVDECATSLRRYATTRSEEEPVRRWNGRLKQSIVLLRSCIYARRARTSSDGVHSIEESKTVFETLLSDLSIQSRVAFSIIEGSILELYEEILFYLDDLPGPMEVEEVDNLILPC